MFAPYKSKVALLLAQWRRVDAPSTSQNAFDSLLKLLYRIVHEKNFSPDDFPCSYYDINKSEHALDILVCELLSLFVFYLSFFVADTS